MKAHSLDMPARLLSVVITLMIVVMCAADASAEDDRCRPEPGLFKRFEAAAAAQPARATPFFAEDGSERAFRDFSGRALVVNFWATWCAPCVEEMPALDRLHGTLQGDGIDVLAISADAGGGPVVRKFYEKNDIRRLPVLIDRKAALIRDLGLPGLPVTLLIAADGREVGRVVGVAAWDKPEVIAFLRACLPGTPRS